ncbi:T9SS type A sorting domain-containing protein [Puia sp. P3]|uniref:T9SS type A sorting domain-containing protein n=1 Tax=Puia sp. P3 TaxID=3423952 RepID=UPI003D6702B1
MSPNPASSQLNVNITKTTLEKTSAGTTTYTVRIVDATGLEHHRSKQTSQSFTIPVCNLKNGNYILEITDGKTISSKPLIISH